MEIDEIQEEEEFLTIKRYQSQLVENDQEDEAIGEEEEK